MMRYAIVTGNTIVDATNNEYGAIEYATKTNPGATYLPFVSHDEVLTDPQYGTGQYIIGNVRTSTLLEKTKVINSGRLYNTESFIVNVMDSWTIMNVSDDVQKAQTRDINKTHSVANSNPVSYSPLTDPKTKTISTKLNASEPLKQSPMAKNPISDPKINPAPSIVLSSHPVSVQPSNPVSVQPSHPVSVQPSNPVSVQPSNPVSVQPSNPVSVQPSNPVSVQPSIPPPGIIQPANNPHKQNLTSLPLRIISNFPLVLSIGHVNKTHRDKIEMLIYSNIACGSLKEENLVVVTNNDPKAVDSWTKKFSACFVYDRLDIDILFHLNPNSKFNKDPISKLVIFDQCLTNDLIHKKQFTNLIDNCRKNNIAMIVMTHDPAVICSTIASKMEYTLVHTFTVDWVERVSAQFLARHPAVASQKDLENNVIACARINNCLAFCHNTPYKMYQF